MLQRRRPVCGLDAESRLATEKIPCGQYGTVIELIINSGFGVLLPFLPLFLKHQGLSPSEVGAIYAAGFSVSCFTATIWYYVEQAFGKRKWILIASVASWVIFVVPFAFAKDHKAFFKFTRLLKGSQNTTTNSTVNMFLYGFDISVTYSFDWDRNYFVTLFFILSIGKCMQSATDYFTFDHECLLRTKPTPEGPSYSRISAMWAVLRCKGPQSLAALMLGCMLDHISLQNKILGHYRICFYAFGCLLMISIVLLNSTELAPPIETATKLPALEDLKQLLSPQFLILAWIMFCLGANRGFYTSFLCLHLHHSGATHMNIASAFAIAKASEFFFHIAAVKLIRFMSSFQMFFMLLVGSAIRALLLSWCTTPKVVNYAVLPELLAGLSDCIHPALSLYFVERSSRLAETLPSKLVHFIFWGLGMKFGSLAGGCLVIYMGSIAALRTTALVSLWTGILFVLVSLDIKAPDDNRFRQLFRQRSILDSQDFLLQNEPLLGD